MATERALNASLLHRYGISSAMRSIYNRLVGGETEEDQEARIETMNLTELKAELSRLRNLIPGGRPFWKTLGLSRVTGLNEEAYWSGIAIARKWLAENDGVAVGQGNGEGGGTGEGKAGDVPAAMDTDP